jgi:hypothetical protein
MIVILPENLAVDAQLDTGNAFPVLFPELIFTLLLLSPELILALLLLSPELIFALLLLSPELTFTFPLPPLRNS